MMSPAEAFRILQGKIRREWRAAFLACFLAGLLIHMPVLLSDIPNHDGLGSMYFDQNMITSGRWFLTVACGFSSYYTIPWLIGLLGLGFLSCAAVVLCEILEVRKGWAAALCGALLSSFPALASTFAYVYTLDGYMLALLLAVAAVLFTKKRPLGFLPGGVCLAFSLGVYQGYLSFAMILAIFAIVMLFAGREPGEAGQGKGPGLLWEKVRQALRYLYMGIIGAALYYLILQLLLRLQGKELDQYQGISGMASGTSPGGGLLSAVGGMYRDFFSFTLKGNVLFQNPYAAGALCLLVLAGAWAAVSGLRRRKCWKNPVFFGIIVLAAAALPLATNIILLISPEVNYHLLMRYQWVLYAIGAVALAGGGEPEGKGGACIQWLALGAATVLVFCYSVTDNIAYSNLQKRYEKTYAYCVRLLDRIEQTPGYYPGIPIAMVGVVGYVQFPVTDITLPVTSNMIGLSGDTLLYTGDNYEVFMKNYLGATLNILPPEAMADMYESEEYVAMDSFPGPNSVRIIDGIMYVKTENTNH